MTPYDLEEVIATSPVIPLPGTFWMYVVADQQRMLQQEPPWLEVRDGAEWSVIRESRDAPTDFASDGYGPLRAMRFQVSRPFAAPGFLAAASTAIADSSAAGLVVSTYSYDYIFVRAEMLDGALASLTRRGFPVDS